MSKLRNLYILTIFHFKGNLKTLSSRFLWEFLQTFLGWWSAFFLVLFFEVPRITYAFGAVVVVVKPKRNYWGGLSLGTVVLADERIEGKVNNALFMHEFGHCLQSRYSGPIYLLKYGLPSLRSAKGRGTHYLHPVEKDANQRAWEFFSRCEGFEKWPSDFNPLFGEACKIKPRWWEYLPLIFPFYPLFKAFQSQEYREMKKP